MAGYYNILVDTSVCLAIIDPAHEKHEHAKQLFESYESQLHVTIYVSNLVMDELFTLIMNEFKHGTRTELQIRQMITSIQYDVYRVRNLEVIDVNREQLASGLQYAFNNPRLGATLADYANLQIAQENKIPILLSYNPVVKELGRLPLFSKIEILDT